jgi:diguanylate cyclase (GGDEF)-like protein/PAS domain S-box-containing protein
MATRILDASPVGMLLVDLGGAVLYSNRALTEMVGYVPAAEHPFPLLDMIYPGDRVAVKLQLDRLARHESNSWRGEYRMRHAGQNPFWVALAATILTGEHGEADKIILQLTNIELQKKAEEALVYAEARWNSALESARQGVWDYDLRKDRMFYSRMWRRMRGIPDDEEIGTGHEGEWLDRVHPEDRERIASISRKQGQGEEGHDMLEYRELTRDGNYIWILSRGQPIEWDQDGSVLRAVGTDTDITRVKAVEQELAAEKERLRVTLDAMADGVIVTDTTGDVVFLNPVAASLLGCTTEDVRGKPSSEIFVLRNAETGEEQGCPGRQCIKQRRVIESSEDLILRHRDGSWRDIRCTASPVTMPDGTLSGAVLVFQDVSQSRALKRQLTHSATHDALSGLLNRAAFEEALERTAAENRINRGTSCLIYVDLDHFKPVNDNAGHAAGDALLKQVAQTIRESCRSHDIVARIGGDEFAVILENCSSDGGMRVAEKLVRAIGSLAFIWVGREYRIGASAGLTMIESGPASPLGFMAEADAACYLAKAEGRNQAILFDEKVSLLSRNIC